MTKVYVYMGLAQYPPCRGGSAPTLLQTLVAPLVAAALFLTFVAWHSSSRPLSQALSRKVCRKNRFLLLTLCRTVNARGPVTSLAF